MIEKLKNSAHVTSEKSKAKVDVQFIALKTLDKSKVKFFKVFKESDMPDFDFSMLKGKKGEVPNFESTQDDDVNTDTEVLNNGKNKCFKDLLVVKEYLRHRPEKVRRSLKTHQIWTPRFNGHMPMKTMPQKRFASQEKIEPAFSPVKKRDTC